jgi:cytochrome c oxidase assembly protein subunit 15
MNRPVRQKLFRRINLSSIVLLFILILAGGIVRSSGSGMGCPDWPKCFGLYVPPSDVASLPKDYKDKYVEGRFLKNQRFAKTLDFFGYGELARRIREDKSILVPDEFNAVKTWTEYINRLIGALSGVFLLGTAFLSFSYVTRNVLISVFSVLNVLLVAVQAWLGSIVVSTNLVPAIVTVHMMLALAILALCIGTYHMAKVVDKPMLHGKLVVRLAAVGVLLITIVQIVFGTDVRERIDAVEVRLQGGYREDWVRNVGNIFYHHRDFAILVVLSNIVLFVLVRQGFGKHSIQQQIMSFTFLLVMLQMVTGIVLAYWSLPPAAQAAHILLASLLFGSQFYLLVNLFKSAGLQEMKV